VFVKSRSSKELQKMQIIRATHLYGKKEIGKENVRGQQEEGGNKEIINVGDRTKCPQCDKIGRVVWISQDGKTAGIQCAAIHRQMNRPERKTPIKGKQEHGFPSGNQERSMIQRS